MGRRRVEVETKEVESCETSSVYILYHRIVVNIRLSRGR